MTKIISAEEVERIAAKLADYPPAPAKHEISALVDTARAHHRLRDALTKVVDWAQRRCPCENEQPNPCPLCGASVENLEACKAVDETFPPRPHPDRPPGDDLGGDG